MIQLLREMVPTLDRVAFAWQPSAGRSQLDVALRVADSLGVETTVLEFSVNDDFPSLLSAIAGPRRTGIIHLSGPGITPVAEKFVAAATRNNLPTLSFLGEAARRGFLMSYGPNQRDYFPRAVQLADRILRGEKAADLPVERPSKFEFIVNLRTARALNLTVPPSLLVRADETPNRFAVGPWLTPPLDRAVSVSRASEPRRDCKGSSYLIFVDARLT